MLISNSVPRRESPVHQVQEHLWRRSDSGVINLVALQALFNESKIADYAKRGL